MFSSVCHCKRQALKPCTCRGTSIEMPRWVWELNLQLALCLKNWLQCIVLGAHTLSDFNLPKTKLNKRKVISVFEKKEVLFLYIKITVCHRFCPGDISWTTQPFLARLGMVVYYMVECHAKKNWFTIFHVKVTVRASLIKIWLFLLYLLNCLQPNLVW